LGLSTNEIKDWQITASSIDEQRKEQCQASFVRLYSHGFDQAWCPRLNQPHQWIQIDFGTPTTVNVEFIDRHVRMNNVRIFY
jgi:hypothetical protein